MVKKVNDLENEVSNMENTEINDNSLLEDKICEIADKYKKEIDFYLNDATYDTFLNMLVADRDEIADLEKEVKMRIDNIKLEYGNKEGFKFYNTSISKIINSKIPLNSEFDESAKDSDFRIVKTEDAENSEYDIQCFCKHIGKATSWESIIKYPSFPSGSKTRTERTRIQYQIKKLKIK